MGYSYHDPYWQNYTYDRYEHARQVTKSNVAVTLAKGYEPYGEVLESYGVESSVYGYTGEWTDTTGLVYLRARYYDPGTGRFTTKDSSSGYNDNPATLNKYNYALSNPILYTDPTGNNPLVLALLPSLIGAAAGFTGGAAAGAIFGACTYDWALAGQCGCEA